MFLEQVLIGSVAVLGVVVALRRTPGSSDHDSHSLASTSPPCRVRLRKTFGQEEVPRTYTYGAFGCVSADENMYCSKP